jgi:hypothetical protein
MGDYSSSDFIVTGCPKLAHMLRIDVIDGTPVSTFLVSNYNSVSFGPSHIIRLKEKVVLYNVLNTLITAGHRNRFSFRNDSHLGDAMQSIQGGEKGPLAFLSVLDVVLALDPI